MHFAYTFRKYYQTSTKFATSSIILPVIKQRTRRHPQIEIIFSLYPSKSSKNKDPLHTLVRWVLFVVTRNIMLHSFPFVDEATLNQRPEKTHIAVVMYTSGSTGPPKGNTLLFLIKDLRIFIGSFILFSRNINQP